MESIYTADTLQELAREILDHAGASPTNAALVADSLVEANLRGHDSHGVLRLTRPSRARCRTGRRASP